MLETSCCSNEDVPEYIFVGDVTRSYRKHTLIDFAHRVAEGVAPVVVRVEVIARMMKRT